MSENLVTDVAISFFFLQLNDFDVFLRLSQTSRSDEIDIIELFTNNFWKCWKFDTNDP